MPRTPHRLSALLRALPLVFTGMLLAPAHAAVVISQVYGGGGNAGAVLQNDFIELLNNGTAAVDIGGWSVQYAAATGTTWQFTAIPAGISLAPGRYYLIRQAAGTGGTVPVIGDLTGTIAMGGTSGKVALSNAAAPLAGAAPTGAAVIDIVSYGASTPTEGAPTPGLSATTAALRNNAGCTDTNNNSADFAVTTPAPRPNSTPAANCEGGAPPPPPPPPPPEPMAATIPEIQGTGELSGFSGQRVITSGVVTKLLNNGFFIQDAAGDGNPATSDGIFVFTSTAPPAAAVVGNLVSVAGTVVEFSLGAGTAATPLTEIGTVTAVTLLGSASPITPTAITLPLPAGQTLERYEGMLVSINGALTVQQNFFQSRYGQITLGAGGKHETPTNRHRPGAQAQALADLQARSRVLLDDSSSFQNPNPTPYFASNGLPRAGDSVSNLVGVIDFGPATNNAAGFGLYRMQPTQPPVFAVGNPRPPAPAAVGGNIKLGAMNVLNYFTTFTNGNTAGGQTGQGCTLGTSTAASNCRGADNLAEFQRQRAKIVLALAGLDADAVGLIEIQNNGNVAAQNLIDALNAQVGAGTYALVPVPTQGTGTDAIRVAMIYKPVRLSLVGNPLSDTDLVNNRPTLAQTFTAANGEKFSLVVNHFKSKGSCPAVGDPDAPGNLDAGDGQGCWNGLRVQQAQRLRTFVGQVQASAGSPDVLVVGDLNSYGQEDPIFDLTSNGYVDEKLRSNAFAYSYIFDGTSGRLDHSLSTNSMSPKITAAAAWHINADEQVSYDYNQEFKAPALCNGVACPPDPYNVDPFRSSDHDPLLVGLNLYKTIAATTLRELLTGTPGADHFVYTSVLQGGDSISGFQPGIDQIVVKDILRSLGRGAVTDPIGAGFITCAASRVGAVASIDADGQAGPLPPRVLVQLNGLNCAAVLVPQNFVVR